MSEPEAIPARLLRRIEKLLALAGSPEAAEAASAAAKAQELLFRHNLCLEDVERTSRKVRRRDGLVSETTAIESDSASAHWQLRLATAVARTSLCAPIHARAVKLGKDGRLHEYERVVFVGRRADMDLALLTFNYLRDTLKRLADYYESVVADEFSVRVAMLVETGHTQAQARAHNPTATAARRSYLEGAVSAISERLAADYAARATATNKSTALVEHRSAEIDDYLTAFHGAVGSRDLRRERPGAPPDMMAALAYESGYTDGAELTLEPPVGRISSGDSEPDE